MKIKDTKISRVSRNFDIALDDFAKYLSGINHRKVTKTEASDIWARYFKIPKVKENKRKPSLLEDLFG